MVQAVSGLMSLTGDPDGPPYRAGISVFDVMAGNHAVIGILAALRHRDATGEGQLVEINLLSSALSGLVNHSSAYAAGGVVPFRMGNAHPSVFPYEPLPTADNDLIVAAANDGQFRAALRACSASPTVADDPRFARNADRTANREQLRPLLVERLRRPAARWSGSSCWSRRACRADRSTPSTAGSPWPSASSWSRSCRPARASGPCPAPATRSGSPATPVQLPAPPAGAGRARRRAAEVAGAHRSGRPWLSSTTPPRSAPPTPTAITLLGQDLAADVMGSVGFGELAFWLATQRRPEPGEVRVFEAVLAALADHGFTPTAIVTRLTYLSAPDSIQGALAAGLLGGGSRFLGVTEDCGRFLHDVLPRGAAARSTRPAGTSWRWRTVQAQRAEPAGSCPGWATTCTRTVTRAPPG